MKGWRHCDWGDIAELRYGKALRDYQRDSGPTQVFGTNGPIGWTDTPPHHDGPGVVVGRKGAYRGIHYARGPFAVIDTAFWLLPRHELDLRWAYYELLTHDINGMDSGSAIPSTSREAFYAMPVAVPSIDEQRAIAATLGALDDKIDCNRRVVDLLMRVADAQYQAACGLSPRTVKVGEVASFHNRRRIPLSRAEREQRPGPYPYYGATGIFGHIDGFQFDEVLVLVGEDGSVVNDDGSPVTQYIWGKCWINNHAHPLAGDGISTELLFLALRCCDVRPIVTGAVQAKISMGNLKRLELELPSGPSLSALESAIAPVFASYRQKLDESQRLRRLRDTLLPELISGRLRVREAAEAVQEVVG